MSGFSVPTKKASFLPNRGLSAKKSADLPAELESQFILRLPEHVANEVRTVVKSGVINLKDRLKLSLEHDNRRGLLHFDNYALHAKVVDLPTIIESHKSLDSKTFYKTADICQMMICTEEDDSKKPDEDESPKKKENKKDEKKDKKFHWPHGITMPLKNVRKRRFRKTLRKKYAEAPEIEKEVKRLFRVDNDAVSVKWEVVTGDEDATKTENSSEKNDVSIEDVVYENNGNQNLAENAVVINSNSQSMDVAEHDLFGGVLSDSDNEDDVNILDSADEDNSRFSTGLGTIDDEDSELKQDSKEVPLVTQFSRSMLGSPSNDANVDMFTEDSVLSNDGDLTPMKQERKPVSDSSEIMNKIEELEQEIAEIQARKQDQEDQVANIENQALKQRLQDVVDELQREEIEKQEEYNQLVLLLNRS